MIEPIKSRFATLLWPLYLVNADPQHVVGPNLLGSRQRLARVLGPGHRLTLGAEVVLAEAVLAGDTVVVLLGRWVEHGGIVKVVLIKNVFNVWKQISAAVVAEHVRDGNSVAVLPAVALYAAVL